VQGDGTAWRGREASGETRDGGAARARRVAGGLGTEQGRERERER